MKKAFLLSIILLALPVIVLSSPSLSTKLQGKILLAVEDKGKTYYVHSDGNRYLITKDTALEVFKKLALGISNENLDQIPLISLGSSETTRCEPTVCKQTSCKIYQDQIVNLLKDVATLKQEKEALLLEQNKVNTDLNKEPTITKQDKIDALKKEYGLKVNSIQAELLELNYLKDNETKIRYLYYDSSKTEFIDTAFKKQVVDAIMEQYKTLFTPGNDVLNYLNKEITDRNTKINVLNNELERKLLEL